MKIHRRILFVTTCKLGLLLLGLQIGLLSTSHANDINVFNYIEPHSVTKVYRYTSESTSAMEGMDAQGWKFDGTLITTHSNLETNDGVKTMIITTETKNLENFPTGYDTKYLERPDGYYSINEDDGGQNTESLILPIGIKVGSSWIGSSFWDEDWLESVVDYEASTGAYKDCLEIGRINGDRTKLSKKVGERQTQTAILCPQVGMVSSTIVNTINAIQFKTVTKMELIEITKNE